MKVTFRYESCDAAVTVEEDIQSEEQLDRFYDWAKKINIGLIAPIIETQERIRQQSKNLL